MATAGMICGIGGIVLCWLAFIGLILGLLGIIFGAIGMSKAGRLGGVGRGTAIAGLVCGILSFFFTAVMAAIAIPAFLEYMNKSKKTQSSLHLRSIEVKIKAFHAMNGRLPNSTEMMPGPPGGACKNPAMKFPAQPHSAWEAAGWKDLGFHIDEDSRYSYQWTSRGPQGGEAIAYADLDCDGTVSETRLRIDVVEGNVRATYTDPTPD
jgi:hypothetical protein